jgi:hypothetical protein
VVNEEMATSFSIKYSGLTRFFQKAVVLSFLAAHGAGGYSISPSFTYYPSVNEDTAPAFRIMQLVGSMTRFLYLRSSRDAALKALEHCYDSIFTLYRRGQASPKDVNCSGQSLLASFFQLLVS